MDVQAILASAQQKFPTTEVSRPVPYASDLANLCVYDENTIDNTSEDALKSNIRDATQHLINQLWKMPTRHSEDHTLILASLPTQANKLANKPLPTLEHAVTTLLPRAKPVPKAKPLTRWQKFALEKGIKKEKRSRMVWDEDRGEWLPRYGFNSAKNQEITKDWLVEIPENGTAEKMAADEGGDEDMFLKKRQAKKERVSKNLKQQARNLGMPKPTADKKVQIDQVIKKAHVSTASMGRFDKLAEGEDKIVKKGAKRQFNAVEDGGQEREVSKRVLAKLMKGAPDAGINVNSKAVNRVMSDMQKKGGDKKNKKAKSRK